MDPVIARSEWEAANFSTSVAMKMKYLHVYRHVFEDVEEMGALMVATDDNVYGVGYNGNRGLLGVPNRTGIFEQEVLVHKLSRQRVTRISVGGVVGAAVTADGRIFHWGRDLRAPYEVEDEYDDDAEIHGVHQPDGSDAHRFVGAACGHSFVAALTTQGQVMVWGLIIGFATVVYGLELRTSQIMAFSCGMYHIALLSTGGDVLTCGLGRDGQLGREWSHRERFLSAKPVTFEHRCTRVVQVACGFHSTLFLMEDGSLLAAGGSGDGFGHLGVQIDELDDHNEVHFPVPVVIDEKVVRIAVAMSICDRSIYAAEMERGNIFTWGFEEYPRKIQNETKLISAFYGAPIPSHLGDVIQPRPSPSRTPLGSAVGRSSVPPNQSPASRQNIPPRPSQPSPNRPDAATRQGLPSASRPDAATRQGQPSPNRPDAATRQGQPSASRPDAATRQRQQTAREANVMDLQSQELAAIITDLSDLRNEIGDLITSVASLQPMRNN